MGVDVVHRLGGNSRVGQSLPHAGGPARSAGSRGGDVVGVAVGAVAHHLGVNFCPPGLGVAQLLQQKGARPLAHDKAGALSVKGDGGPQGVAPLVEGLHSGKAPHGQRGNRSFAAAAQHYLGVTVPDVAEGVAHGVGPSGAGGYHAGAHALEAVADGHMARRHVGDNHGDHEGRDRIPAPLAPPLVGLTHHLEAADAAGEDYPAAVQILLLPVQAGVGHALVGGRQGELGEAVHLLGLPLAQQGVQVQILYLSGQLHLHIRRIVPGNGADAACPGLDGRPALGHGISYRVDGSHAGDYHSAFFHCASSLLRQLLQTLCRGRCPQRPAGNFRRAAVGGGPYRTYKVTPPCRRPRTAPVR